MAQPKYVIYEVHVIQLHWAPDRIIPTKSCCLVLTFFFLFLSLFFSLNTMTSLNRIVQVLLNEGVRCGGFRFLFKYRQRKKNGVNPIEKDFNWLKTLNRMENALWIWCIELAKYAVISSSSSLLLLLFM